MRFKHSLTAILLGSMASAASGLTLEELAARLDSLEKKVAAYEDRYGPLDQPKRHVISEPAPAGNASSVVPAPKGGLQGDIDSQFLSGSRGGSGGWWEKTSLGGYGELHLNTGDTDQIDFHRWVLFLNHSFSDRIKLVSELELEHSLSGDGKPGEVELEQAYIDFAFNDGLNVKVGQYLIPVGLLNETHEPDTFFGVERNNVEKNIIPTTWWEGGVAATKTFDNGLSFDVGVHSALAVSTDPMNKNAFRIRSGRQKVAEADATEWAATARVKYSGINGLDLSAFVNYQNDLAPGNLEDNSAILLGGTAVYQNGGFGLRALVAHWDIDGASFQANDADSQWGYFVEPSYTWQLGGNSRVGVFARHSSYDYARSVGNTRGGDFHEYTFGVNYWPIDGVVLKADYTQVDQKGGSTNETLNFGVGYSF